MTEFEPTPTPSEETRPATRQIGDRVLRITYLPDVDPQTVRETDQVDHEFIGKTAIQQAYSAVENSRRRAGKKPKTKGL